VGDVLDDVLHAQQFVGLLHQGAELGADLALAGSGHFVVLHFHFDADLFQGLAHFRAQVVQRVGRRHGEIPALHRRTVAAVGAVVLVTGAPRGFFGIDLEEGVAHVVGEADRVEDEELRLRAEEGLLGDAGGLQVGLGALGDAARAAAIRLHGGRVEDVAADDQGRVGVERIDVGAGRVREQDHVRFVDAFPAGDRAAIEHLAFFKQRRLHDAHREGDVLFDTAHVDETQVDELDLVVLDQLLNVFHGHR